MHFPLDGRTPKSWLRGSPKGLPASGGDGVRGRAPGQTKSDKIADRNKGEKVTKSLTLDSCYPHFSYVDDRKNQSTHEL